MRGLWQNDGRHWASAAMAVTLIAGAAVWANEYATTQAQRPEQVQAEATVPGLIGPPAIARLSRVHAKTQPLTTTLATIRFTAQRYASPGGRENGQVPATWWGVPSVLPVVTVRPGWVKVRLAQRPNGSTAWLPASDVRLSSTDYRIVINLKNMRLTLFERDKKLMSAPAGIGHMQPLRVIIMGDSAIQAAALTVTVPVTPGVSVSATRCRDRSGRPGPRDWQWRG